MENTKKSTPKNPLFEKITEENITEESNININAIQPKHNFYIVYDTIYKNNDLSATEKGLLLNLLTMAPTFKPTKNGLMYYSKLSRREYETAIKNLKKKGYLTIKKNGTNNYDYIVSQQPQISAEYLTYEYLSENYTYQVELFETLLLSKMITKEIYDQLIDHIKAIATIKWVNK